MKELKWISCEHEKMIKAGEIAFCKCCQTEFPIEALEVINARIQLSKMKQPRIMIGDLIDIRQFTDEWTDKEKRRLEKYIEDNKSLITPVVYRRVGYNFWQYSDGTEKYVKKP